MSWTAIMLVLFVLAIAAYFVRSQFAPISKTRSPYPVQACLFSMDDGTQSWDSVLSLLKQLDKQGYALALVTSQSRPDFEKRMAGEGAFEVLDTVHAVVTINEVASGKPAPDLYVEAARRLRVDPTRCLVFDETPSGVDGARLAGMLTAAVGPAVSARFGELAPEWMLRNIGSFNTREIVLASASAAEVKPQPPSLLSRFLPVGALAVCLGTNDRTAGYGPAPSTTVPSV